MSVRPRCRTDCRRPPLSARWARRAGIEDGQMFVAHIVDKARLGTRVPALSFVSLPAKHPQAVEPARLHWRGYGRHIAPARPLVTGCAVASNGRRRLLLQYGCRKIYQTGCCSLRAAPIWTDPSPQIDYPLILRRPGVSGFVSPVSLIYPCIVICAHAVAML